MRIAYERLFVDKPAQTFADNLTAAGLMYIINAVYDNIGVTGHILLQDCGSYYEISLDPPLESDWLGDVQQPMAPIPFIETTKNADKLPDDAPKVDYETEKDQRSRYFAAEDRDTVAQPHQHWDVFRAINPPALPGYTSLVENWWRIQAQLPEVLAILFQLFSHHPNDRDAAQAAWQALDKEYEWGIKAEATCQQLYNPDQGKGQNKPKANGLSIGNEKNFWLLEYLKAVGFYEVAITRVVKGDRKTFVIAPCELDYTVQQNVMSNFRKSMRSAESSIRFDILASLRYARTLIAYYLALETPEAEPWFEDTYYPSDQVAGFRTAFYKDLGNAVATMNLAFLALPGWIVIETHEDAEAFTQLLAEDDFISFVRQFDESNSDAFRLLRDLRDFVSGSNLKAFFRFTAAFSGYYMGMKERGKYAKPLTPAFLDRLMKSMSTEDMRLYEIVQNEGFQNVAYAIRQSTIVAQYAKTQGNRKYDVRYGLGQDLIRKARYPNDFMVALSDFVAKFNAENAQIMETRPGPYRRSIQTSDIEAVAALIDECGSELIGNMLVAYGYARSPRQDDNPVEGIEEDDDSTL